VNESAAEGESDGSISFFRIQNDSLIFVDKIHSYGNNPCHVMITADNFVITSNYTGGNIVLSQLDQKGKLTFLDSKKQTGDAKFGNQNTDGT